MGCRNVFLRVVTHILPVTMYGAAVPHNLLDNALDRLCIEFWVFFDGVASCEFEAK